MTTDTTTLTPPKNPAERRAWVVFQLKLRGQSLASVAASLGVCRQAVSGALMTPSERIEQALADALSLPIETLFPERFDGKGFRIPRTRPANISAGRAPGDSQNERHTQTETHTQTGRAA